VPLALAPGRVLAAPVTARVSMPAWTNRSMDGYAVRAADLQGAAPGGARRAPGGRHGRRGARAPGALAPGSATRIMTGAPLPDGPTPVVRVEDTDAGLDVVRIHVAGGRRHARAPARRRLPGRRGGARGRRRARRRAARACSPPAARRT
jgi:molybdopterin molybdotransferase